MADRVERAGGGAHTGVGDLGVLVLAQPHGRGLETEQMERLAELLRRLPGTSEVLDEAVAKGYRTYCILRPERVLATDEDLEAFKRVLDEARRCERCDRFELGAWRSAVAVRLQVSETVPQ